MKRIPVLIQLWHLLNHIIWFYSLTTSIIRLLTKGRNFSPVSALYIQSHVTIFNLYFITFFFYTFYTRAGTMPIISSLTIINISEIPVSRVSVKTKWFTSSFKCKKDRKSIQEQIHLVYEYVKWERQFWAYFRRPTSFLPSKTLSAIHTERLHFSFFFSHTIGIAHKCTSIRCA